MVNQVRLAPSTGQSYRTPDVTLVPAVGQSYRSPDVVLAPISRQYIAPSSTTLYTYPVGIASAQYGTHEVSRVLTQFVYPTGFSSTAFGALSVGRTTRPAGFSTSAFGTAWVSNLRRYLYANGTKFGSFGTALVQNRDLHPSAWQSSVFGTLYVYNKTRKAYPPGILATTFGTAKVENHKITINGLVHTFFGTALVKNYRQYANVSAGVRTVFGTQWVSTKIRRIYMWHPGVYYAGQIGTARLTHTRITPRGFVDTRFGVAWAAQEFQYLYPWSFLDVLFGNQTAVTYWNQPRQMQGFIATQFGAGSMIPLYLHPVGIAPHGWPFPGPDAPWWATKVTHDRVKNTTLGLTQSFGAPYVSHSPIFVYPPSFDVATLWGVPPYGVMHKFDQWVDTPGILGEEWGRDDWDYRQGDVLEEIDYLHPTPAAMSAFGNATAGHA